MTESGIGADGKMKNSNRPMEQIPVPSGLLACLLLIPLRGQETRQKQAGIPHRGRSIK